MSEIHKGALEMEKTRERSGMYIGRLGDLGIGNPDGIPSAYANVSDDTLTELAKEQARKLVAVTEQHILACIDGRTCICNVDGSEPAIRYRRVGGSAASYGVARNAEASIVDTLSDADSLGHQIHVIEQHIGYDRSAHQGSCGGANGEIVDNEAIHSNPAIMAATKALMEIPQVKTYFGVGFNDELGEKVRQAAEKTAMYLRSNNWNGQQYVDGVCSENPHGVEDLATDPNDPKFGGHKENTLTIIIGNETLAEDDEFVWNLHTTKQIAERLAGQRGEEGYQQALIAEVAKHISVANRLPSDKTPILLLES